MKAQILKRLVSLGQNLEVGDIVDVTSWRHTKGLVNNRYIKLIEEEAKPIAKTKAEPKVEAVEEVKPKKATKKDTVEE
jgi:hypothetical protein